MFIINLNRSDIVFSIVLLLLILILPNRRIHSISNDDESDYFQQVEDNDINKIWFNDYSDNDNFNLFNLFNVFRGTQSKLLDEHGNFIPLDNGKSTAIKLNQDNNKNEFQKLSRKDDDRVHQSSPAPVQARGLNLEQFRLKFVSNLFGSSANKPIGPPGAIQQQIDSSINSDLNKVENNLKQLVGNKNDKNVKQQQTISSPIIMVPGYGGTRLEAKLNKPSVVRYFCDLESDWSDVWINVKLLLPYMIDCLIDNLRLEYNPLNHTTHNTPGVDIRVKNPNSITSVEYLHQLPLSGFAYFAPIVDKIIDSFQGGYERELNIRGAPYDFRKAPNELGEHFENIKYNTESLYDSNNEKKITFICHSMGCNQMLYFFYKQPQEWKDKYVKRLISLAAPWAGSFSALRAAALGDDLGMPYLFSESKLIKVQRSLPSTIFLFPNKQVFSDVPLIRSNVVSEHNKFNTILEKGNNVPQQQQVKSSSSNDTSFIVQQSTTLSDNQLRSAKNQNDLVISQSASNNSENNAIKHYTIDNFKSFFDDINHPDGYKMWLDTKDLLGNLEAPGVEIWCLVGKGQKTLGRMEFLGPFPNSPAVEFYDDGDGTVTLESARYCTKWADKQKEAINYREFDLSHMAILKDNQVLDYIGNILKQN